MDKPKNGQTQEWTNPSYDIDQKGTNTKFFWGTTPRKIVFSYKPQKKKLVSNYFIAELIKKISLREMGGAKSKAKKRESGRL